MAAVLPSGTGQRCCTSAAVRFSITGPGRYATTAYEAVDLCGCFDHEPSYPSTLKGGATSEGDAKPSVDGQTFSYLADAVVPIEHEFAGAGHDVTSTLRWLPLGSAVTL